jgi:hypothetical protein
VNDIFTPTPDQRRASALFRWLLVNDPDASTIGIRALVRHQEQNDQPDNN